jgi:hypothetical protein
MRIDANLMKAGWLAASVAYRVATTPTLLDLVEDPFDQVA